MVDILHFAFAGITVIKFLNLSFDCMSSSSSKPFPLNTSASFLDMVCGTISTGFFDPSGHTANIFCRHDLTLSLARADVSPFPVSVL